MPRPRVGTPTARVLAEIDAVIRLGIGRHSVLAAPRAVKHRCSETFGTPLAGRRRTHYCSGLRCRAPARTSKW